MQQQYQGALKTAVWNAISFKLGEVIFIRKVQRPYPLWMEKKSVSNLKVVFFLNKEKQDFYASKDTKPPT